ncbi:hypothetical protein [Corynebacterium glutamicum]|uniref:hypothetical protein n=1 Tax=Corynebacterium glutamicum TaxID=1718 RepID=UPI000AD92AB7|nr:hypothetical protein [Corynebacterium glutamicum]
MGVDRRMWKMSPERLQEHLQLKNRARQIPDKKKQQNKRACRDYSRRASRISGVFPRGRLLPSPCWVGQLSATVRIRPNP